MTYRVYNGNLKIIMGWGLPGVKFSAQSSLSSFSRLKDQVVLVAIYPHTEQFEEDWALPYAILVIFIFQPPIINVRALRLLDYKQ